MAVAYAAMHDTPARMLAVGVLRGIVPWRRARAFFVARLRRRWAQLANREVRCVESHRGQPLCLQDTGRQEHDWSRAAD